MRTIKIVTLSSSSLLSLCYCNITYNDNEKTLQLGNRMKSGLTLSSDNVILKHKDNNLKVYEPRAGRFICTNNIFNNVKDDSKGHWLVSRVVQMEINANADDIANVWMNQGQSRCEWDTTCSKSKALVGNSNRMTLNYYRGHGGALLTPAREYVTAIEKTHGGVVGINNIMTIVLVSINDDSSKFPATFNTVRGYMNSILILEKKNADKTMCTLLIETDPKGWLYPVSGIVSYIMQNRLIKSMTNFKNLFEKDKDSIENMTMSVEQIARKKFEKSQKDKNKETTIEEVTIYKDDLIATIKMLEAKLSDISKTERNDKIDLTQLKDRVRSDLIAARNKLSGLK